jgi:hypothetical protein
VLIKDSLTQEIAIYMVKITHGQAIPGPHTTPFYRLEAIVDSIRSDVDVGKRRRQWLICVCCSLCEIAVCRFCSHWSLHFFNSYSDVYGSLGAVIILLTWFYLRRVAVDSEHY